tara:strand:+ start:836 stop:1528 length:693 start_codon:yes stop_codon:yes gene_type:complete
MAFKMKNPGMGKLAKEAGSPAKFGIENKGIDSAARGTKGIDAKSPMKAKDKFKVSTKDRDFLSKKQNELIDKRIEDQARQDIDRGSGIKVDNYQTSKEDKETLPSMNYDSKKDKFYSSGSSGTVDVKVKGKKKGISGPGESSMQDIKKVKLSKGKGKRKSTTKIKYDKQGNVKKVVNRTGRFGLRKGSGVSLGEGESKVTGRKAAEKVLATKTENKIRGKAKRQAGDKKL